MEVFNSNAHHTSSNQPHTPLPTVSPNVLTTFASTLSSLHTNHEAEMHVVTTVLTLVLPVLALLYIHKDYKSFLSLGPGGTPATPLGYLKIKLLSLFSLRDPLRPIAIPAHFRPQHGYLSSPTQASSLPKREGTRPKIRGIAPQRQRTQTSSPAIYAKLSNSMKALAAESKNKLLERTSCFEKHSSGLFTSDPLTRVCGGEICHAHPSDGSLHLSLHPADVRVLIEQGWGERHPLAKGGWFRRFVPKEFVLVYAPRDNTEVDVVMQIVAAAIWWVSGRDVFNNDSGEQEETSGEQNKRLSDQDMGDRKEGECWACRVHACGDAVKNKMVSRA